MSHGATVSKQTHKEYTITQFANEYSSEICLDRATILRYLSLLNLTPEVKEMVSEDKLGVKLASQLATVEKDKQEDIHLKWRDLARKI